MIISNGSGVIVLTDRQTNTHTQTDTTENNNTVAALVVNRLRLDGLSLFKQHVFVVCGVV